MKKLLTLALTAALIATMSACGGQPSPSPADQTQAPADATQAPADQPTEPPVESAPPAVEGEGEIKMAMVTDVGGVNDESFNHLAWQGHEQAKAELGMNTWYIESKQESDYAPNLGSVYDEGAQLIWGIGFMMADSVHAAAEQNPDAMYAIIDNAYPDDQALPNLVGITFKEQEPSFLVGYVAGKMTKSNKVGFVGGMDSDVIRRFNSGYVAGVKYANKDCEVVEQYAGNFNDVAMGKSIAQKMYQDGCDIVFHAAGATGNGVIQAAAETGKPADGGKWVIGVDTDQNHLAPDNVLTSSCKGVDVAIMDVAKEFKAGTLKGGSNRLYGLKEGGVSIATTGNFIPAEILTEVDQLSEQIKSGSLVVPGTVAELEPFVANLP